MEAIFNNTGIQLSKQDLELLRAGCVKFSREVSAEGVLDRALEASSAEVRQCFGESHNSLEVSTSTSDMARKVADIMREECC